jgi:hypothetical protein
MALSAALVGSLDSARVAARAHVPASNQQMPASDGMDIEGAAAPAGEPRHLNATDRTCALMLIHQSILA